MGSHETKKGTQVWHEIKPLSVRGEGTTLGPLLRHFVIRVETEKPERVK